MTNVQSTATADSIETAARLLQSAHHAVALTGAGLSAESGIPTYRGTGGVWTRFGEPTIDGWDLFCADPTRWWHEALAHQSGANPFGEAIEHARPNAGHLAMARLEATGHLAHVITQNIDNLHEDAGSHAVTEIHGNRRRVRCINCGARDRLANVSLDWLPPTCPECGGILKNDTVMFGEPIPEDALRACFRQTAAADVFLVIGTSAVVYPAASFPIMARERGVPLIEINPEPTDLSEVASLVIRAPAGIALPAIVDYLEREGH